MKNKYRFIVSAWAIIAFGITSLQAQHAFTSSGGDATGSGGSVSFSVGQMVYSSYVEEQGSITEGVQQPYELFIITSANDLISDKIHLRAFPNPVISQLTLSVAESHYTDVSYRLSDMHGQLIRSEHISDGDTAINMDFLRPGAYFLQVFEKERLVGAFKIIKR